MRRPSPATTIACIALFFSLAGTGLAAGKYLLTSTKQIKPSVLNSLKGKQGPRGLQGLAGPAGAVGAAGAAGAAGVGFTTSDVTVVDGPAVTLNTAPNANATNGSSAQCPTGDVVLGGGFAWAGTPATDAQIQYSEPVSGTSWDAVAQNSSTTQMPAIFALAICGS